MKCFVVFLCVVVASICVVGTSSDTLNLSVPKQYDAVYYGNIRVLLCP